MAGDKREAKVIITGDSSAYKKAMTEAEQHTSKSGAAITGIFAGIGLGATNLAVGGIGKVVDFLGESSKVAKEDEVNMARLTTALRDNVAGFKGTADAMEGAIDKGKTLGFTDDETSASLARLVTVTKDTKQAQSDMSIAMDLARARGIDLDTATQMVTKAQLGNVGALKKQGIEVLAVTTAVDALKASHEKYTPAQMAAAVAADKQATATAALAAIQKASAGQAEAYAGTMQGSMTRAAIIVETIQEKLGGAINNFVATVLPPLIDGLGTIAGAFGQVLTAVTPLVEAIRTLIVGHLDILGPLLVGPLAVGVGVWVAGMLATAAATIAALPSTLAMVAAWIAANAPLILIAAAIAAVVLVITHWQDIVKVAGPIISGVFNTISSTVGTVTTAITTAINGVTNTVIPALQAAFQTAGSIIGGVWSGISTAVRGAINLVIGGVNTLIGGINSIKIPAIDVGPVHFAGWEGINLAKIPTLAVGTPYVQDDGLAWLHKGEAVVPAHVNPARGGGGAVQVSVNISGSAIFDPYGTAAQQISQALLPGLKRALSANGMSLA